MGGMSRNETGRVFATMRITLSRYYYTETITKSRMMFLSDEGKTLFECEAHETMFRDYTEKFPGCSDYCMPTGTFPIKVKSGAAGPMTMFIMKVPGHMAMQICWHATHQTEHCRVLVGEETSEDPETSRLTRQMETYERIEQLIYDSFINGETFEIDVRNEIDMDEMCA